MQLPDSLRDPCPDLYSLGNTPHSLKPNHMSRRTSKRSYGLKISESLKARNQSYSLTWFTVSPRGCLLKHPNQRATLMSHRHLVDFFTEEVEAIPLPNEEAVTMAQPLGVCSATRTPFSLIKAPTSKATFSEHSAKPWSRTKRPGLFSKQRTKREHKSFPT